MTGRPTIRTTEIVESILDQIGDGTPLAAICRQEGMPKLRTVYDWLEADPDLSARFARARLAGIDMIAVDALQIADTPIEGERRKVTDDGVEVTTEDMLGHRKLQVETRLKLLRCWDPKRYGDKLEVDNKGEMTLNIGIKRFTPDPDPTT